MATDGENFNIKHRAEELKAKREARIKRWENASSKQKKCWMKFRTSGAAGFAEGSAGSLVNRLRVLANELPPSHPTYADIQRAISEIELLRKFGIPTGRTIVIDQINKSEV